MNPELSFQLARNMAAMPEYFAPCPASSIAAMPDIDDVIRRPSCHRGRSGVLIFSACGASCRACAPFQQEIRPQLGTLTVAQVAAEWTQYLRALAADGADERITITLARLNARGMLPEGFFSQSNTNPKTTNDHTH